MWCTAHLACAPCLAEGIDDVHLRTHVARVPIAVSNQVGSERGCCATTGPLDCGLRVRTDGRAMLQARPGVVTGPQACCAKAVYDNVVIVIYNTRCCWYGLCGSDPSPWR